MKDPAILFYTQDFLVGCLTMTFEDRGKYITILSTMHQQGRMNEETIRFLVGSISDNLKNKFSIDKHSMWYNERLELEMDKRASFVASRRINGSKGGRPKQPLGKPIGKPKNNLIENEDIIKDIIMYLNKKANKSYKTTSNQTIKFITARLNESWSIQDFKKVIDNKVRAWLNDSDMNQYLRPETLFSNKFEGYLNESIVKTETQSKLTESIR